MHMLQLCSDTNSSKNCVMSFAGYIWRRNGGLTMQVTTALVVSECLPNGEMSGAGSDAWFDNVKDNSMSKVVEPPQNNWTSNDFSRRFGSFLNEAGEMNGFSTSLPALIHPKGESCVSFTSKRIWMIQYTLNHDNYLVM